MGLVAYRVEKGSGDDVTEKATTTAASVAEPAGFPTNMNELGGGVLAAAVTMVGMVMYFRRKVSRDNTEIIQDRATGKFTQQLMDELAASRENAKEAWGKFNELNAEVGQLRAEKIYLSKEVDRLTAELTSVQSKLDVVREDLWKLRKAATTRKEAIDSGHAPLSS